MKRHRNHTRTRPPQSPGAKRKFHPPERESKAGRDSHDEPRASTRDERHASSNDERRASRSGEPRASFDDERRASRGDERRAPSRLRPSVAEGSRPPVSPSNRVSEVSVKHTSQTPSRREPSGSPKREPFESSSRRERPESSNDAQVYGVLPVLEALRAGTRPVERVTIAEGAHEARLRDLLELARRANIPVRRVPRAELQRLAAGANHQGIVATIAAARYHPADELLDALAARVGTDDPPLALVLDGVEDPRNLGAIIRTAECAGAHSVFVPERRAAGLTETVAKAAAGALEYVAVARTTNIARLIEEFKKRGIWTVGTSAEAGVDYTAWDWSQPCALFLGGEGAGLRRLVRERCDVLVRVPLRGRIESLNVSVAAGVVLYEAVRQRTAARAATYKDATYKENEHTDE